MKATSNGSPTGLAVRVLSAVIGIPVVLGALMLGRLTFSLLVIAVMAVALNEFYSLLKGEFAPNFGLGVLGGILLGLGAFVAGSSGLVAALAAVVGLSLLWLLFSRSASMRDAGATLTGVLYCGLFLSHFILSYNLPDGTVLILLVLLATWASDIAAYAFGARFGRRKLAGRISPNKTVEGALAGLAAPAALIGLLGLVPAFALAESGSIAGVIRGVVFGGTIGLVAPMGDLVESRIKREFGAKDSGRTVPGHGGILDRIDSLLFTGVVAYYLWQVLA